MTRRRLILLAIPCLLAAVAGLAVAQYRGRLRRRPVPARRHLPADRAGVPNWKIDERFKNDVFTFVRVEYDSGGVCAARGGGGGWRGRSRSRRLGRRLGDRLARQRPQLLLPPPAAHLAQGQPRPDHAQADRRGLFDYPFLYMIEPGAPRLLGRGGRGAAPLPAQRRLPDGRRLLGRLRSGRTSTEQIKRVFPEPRAGGAAAHARDLPLRLPAQGEAAGPEHPQPGGLART